MDIQFIAGIVSSIIFIIALSRYVYDVAKGRVRVAIASIALLALINLSQLGALIAKDLWYVVPFTAAAFIMNCFIIIFGLRNGKFR